MISKTDCCVHTLEVLLSQVKHLTDLDLIEGLIDSYTDMLKIDLIRYKHEVKQMREEFPKRVFYLEVQRER